MGPAILGLLMVAVVSERKHAGFAMSKSLSQSRANTEIRPAGREFQQTGSRFRPRELRATTPLGTQW